jgi:signal transduction histidine kinase
MLLGDSFSKWANSENKHWVELIRRNAATALRLIEDVLDIERIAQGKLTLRFAQANVCQVIRESIENLVNVASAKNILLRASNMENVGLAVVDRDRIMQVLSNLIGNALKFTPEGGSVVLNAYNESDRLLISVRDTGPGIEDEQKESIFERFAQVSSPDRKGLGLGLYISKMLIEAHQGRIWVQSDLEKGSTFWISIPRQGPSGRVQAH